MSKVTPRTLRAERERPSYRQTDRQSVSQTDRQTDTKSDRQTDKQTGRQTYRELISVRYTFHNRMSCPKKSQLFFLVNPLPVRAPSSVCNVDGQTYDDGDSMEVYNGDLNSGECDQCTCKEGKLIDCHHIFHCVLNDSSCNSYSKKPGQCCPTCERGITRQYVK